LYGLRKTGSLGAFACKETIIAVGIEGFGHFLIYVICFGGILSFSDKSLSVDIHQ